MTFSKWIDTLIAEKGISTELYLEIEGPSGLNMMPLSYVIEAIKSAPKSEKDRIKKTLIMIDFKNGDITHFFKHLAQAIAI